MCALSNTMDQPFISQVISQLSCFLRFQTEEEERQNRNCTINSATSFSSYITSKRPPQVIQGSTPPYSRALTWQGRQR